MVQPHRPATVLRDPLSTSIPPFFYQNLSQVVILMARIPGEASRVNGGLMGSAIEAQEAQLKNGGM